MFCDLKKPGALVSAVLPKENADLPKKLLFLREKQFPQVRLRVLAHSNARARLN